MSTTQICAFTVGRYQFGMPVEHVQEILRNQKVQRVPLAPAEIAGLVNLRGQIKMAVNLQRLLTLESDNPAPQLSEVVHIVISNVQESLSLIADSVMDVIVTQSKDLEPIVETIPESIKFVCSGVIKQNGCLMYILSIDKLIHKINVL